MPVVEREHTPEFDGDCYVPEGVVKGMEDIIEGRTASKEELASVLKF